MDDFTSNTGDILWSDADWQLIRESATIPDGRVKTAVRVKRADSVHLIAYKTPSTILLLREYRPYYGSYVWMLPGGRVDKEADVIAAAQRELQEEAGFRAEKITPLSRANYSESIMATTHVVIAEGLAPDPLPQDADELIEVHECSPDEALEKVLSSNRVHLASAYALLLLLRKRKRAAQTP